MATDVDDSEFERLCTETSFEKREGLSNATQHQSRTSRVPARAVYRRLTPTESGIVSETLIDRWRSADRAAKKGQESCCREFKVIYLISRCDWKSHVKFNGVVSPK